MALYKRILLKLSGEALKGKSSDIFDSKIVHELAKEIKELSDNGIEIGVVVGGGNIFRGRVAEELNLERVNADFMGMVATNINGLLLENAFIKNGLKAKCLSMLPTKNSVEKFTKSKALKYLSKGYIVIFSGGTGKPYFSTDTAAAIKAKEIGAEVILAGKNGVDGVYDKDPTKNETAKMYSSISYDEYINKNLAVLDVDAVKRCKEDNIKIRVFNLNNLNNIHKVIKDEKIGTIIK